MSCCVPPTSSFSLLFFSWTILSHNLQSLMEPMILRTIISTGDVFFNLQSQSHSFVLCSSGVLFCCSLDGKKINSSGKKNCDVGIFFVNRVPRCNRFISVIFFTKFCCCVFVYCCRDQLS